MNNENKFTLLLKTLDELRRILKHEAEVSTKLKQWCISVWIGILAFIATGKMTITVEQAFILPFIPIFLFFFLDIFQGALITQITKKIYMIEELLVTKSFDEIEVKDVLLFNYRNFSTWSEKIKLYFRSMIIPRGSLFYLLLILTTLFFNSFAKL
jgi:hypothetical protein